MLDLRSKLATPWVFRLFKDVIGAKAAIATFVADHVRPAPGERILDLGCGLGDILEHLPAHGIEYVGIDVSEEYVAWARSRYGARATFHRMDLSEDSPEGLSGFDLVLAVGVLHHLSDAEAARLIHLARAALTPDGRLVTFDGCYTREQSRFSRLIVSRDRGRYVRTAAHYQALAEEGFRRVDVRIRHDLLRIPYAHIIMECSA